MENENENKVWIGKDGIINVELPRGGKDPLGDIKRLIRQLEDISSPLKGEAKVLVEIGTSLDLSYARSSRLRREISDYVRKWKKSSQFKKIAIFGGNIVRKTVTSFIIMASGTKNMMAFSTREEALKWLKEP